MIRNIVRAGMLLTAMTGASALLAKMYVDYTPGKGVWEVNTVEVDGNHIDDYLTGLKRSQVPAFEFMKKRGLIDEYKYLVRNGYTKGHPTVVILVHFTSVAALEPDRARDEAIEREAYAALPEAQAKVAVEGYEKYRTILDDAFYTEVRFTK